MEVITITGVEPVAASRPRVDRRGILYVPTKTTNFEKLIAMEYQKQSGAFLSGAVYCEIVLYYEPPKSLSKRKREALMGMPRDKKPDADNLGKAIMDGLTKGGAWKDDGCVSTLVVRKLYGEEYKIEIRLREMT